MCGLYSFRKSPEETRTLFDYVERPNFPPRPYVTPGGPIAIVRAEQAERHFVLVRWGLVPSWMKEVKPGKPLINARSETVIGKPSFRNAMKRRRCLIPADGFYEWRGEPGRKQAFFIHRPDDALFAFAGLWESWMGADGSELESACIVTTSPNKVVAEIHTRMPVVIEPGGYATWLDTENTSIEEAAQLLAPAPDDFFIAGPTRIERRAPPPKPKLEMATDQMKLL